MPAIGLSMDLHDDDRLVRIAKSSPAVNHRADFAIPFSVDYNGVVPEKFDVVKLSHLVDAEYGNQGLDFKMLNREGFAWTNGRSLTCINLSLWLIDFLCL
jgi:neutral trehalase